MSNERYILHQQFQLSIGEVRGQIYYRHRGAGVELGEDAPMIFLVTSTKAKMLGRPSSDKTTVWIPAHSGYGLDAKGNWWSVRWDKLTARARTLNRPPHAKLGRRRVGWVPVLKQKAAAALHAALVAQYAERCPLI